MQKNVKLKNLLSKTIKYLNDLLGTDIEIYPSEINKKLPIAIREQYYFYKMNILNQHLCIMVNISDNSLTAGTIAKHKETIEEKSGSLAVYITTAIEAYNRKRLIEQKISFIVPENQMYLPILGIDLREYFKQVRKDEKATLTPSAQLILLKMLYDKEFINSYNSTKMSKNFGYSHMTIKRAFNDLLDLDLISRGLSNNKYEFHLSGSHQEVWEKAQNFLQSPVKKKVIIQNIEFTHEVYKAGLSALAHYEMINEPKKTIFAVSQNTWKKLLEENRIVEVPILEGDVIEIEVWNYDPGKFTINEYVDKLSLVLSLKDNRDERIEIACEKIINNMDWPKYG